MFELCSSVCFTRLHFLSGITVGDIGPKFGTNAVDNGFVMFDHVRIPLNQMLMGLSKVLNTM